MLGNPYIGRWAELGGDLYGNVPLAGEGQFPILIKFLDAREDLRYRFIRTRLCRCESQRPFKNRSLVRFASDPDARLLMGLKPGATRELFEAAIGRGNVDQLIETFAAKEGECYYLPSGTVHALGAGLLVAEVQTPSDTTFRVFDFNRMDPSTQKLRTLHVKQALKCIDFASPAGAPLGDEREEKLVATEYFHIERRRLHPGMERKIPGGEPIALIMIQGSVAIGSESAARGEVLLLPAALNGTTIQSPTGCTWLAVTFPMPS